MSALVITAWSALTAAGEGAARDPLWSERDGEKTSRITASIRTLWSGAPDRIGRMDRPSAHALFVASRCLSLAKLDEPRTRSLAVIVGTALGCAEVNERYHRGLVERGSEGASPILFAQTIPSAPAGEVAIALGAKGHATTVMTGRASAVAAFVEARRSIALGRADAALVLVGDTLGADRARLRRERGESPAAEACAGFVIEREVDASARGATALAALETASLSSHDGGDDHHVDWLGASGAMELAAWLADGRGDFSHDVLCASGRRGALRLRRI